MHPSLSIVVAYTRNRAIGKDQDLPWHLPADFNHFKRLTTGHWILMGRKTFEALGKPLPKRPHVIITRDPSYTIEHPDCYVTHSLGEAIEWAQQKTDQEIFLIGGGEIFLQALEQNLVNKMYLTLIDAYVEADAYFPEFNPADWQEISRTFFAKDAHNEYNFEIVVLQRI